MYNGNVKKNFKKSTYDSILKNAFGEKMDFK